MFTPGGWETKNHVKCLTFGPHFQEADLCKLSMLDFARESVTQSKGKAILGFTILNRDKNVELHWYWEIITSLDVET